MTIYIRLIFSALTLVMLSCRSGEKQQSAPAASLAPLCVGFYNVENLFDTADNPDKIDEDFTPTGRYKWTEAVYQQKRENLARAISSIGTNGPDILGLAEVENKRVIEELIQTGPLATRSYGIVHAETPDMRGIDNALIYDKTLFTEVSHEAIEVDFPAESDYTSRKILVVSGKWNGSSLHILVNHWPSRGGGAEKSEPRRLRAATVARAAYDRLLAADADADIILMGDLNDDPFDRSVVEVARARKTVAEMKTGDLFNATYALHDPDNSGTLTYKGKWNLFDQLLLSEGLLDTKAPVRLQEGSVRIHHPEFMLVGGNGRSKDMPRRAIYRGEFQERGFSDHFPVFMLLEF